MARMILFLILIWEVKESKPSTELDRLFGLLDVKASRISRQPVDEGVKAVSPRHWL